MNTTTNTTYAHPAPACLPHETGPVNGGAGDTNANESRFSHYLRIVVAFCWVASRGTLQKILFTYFQSTIVRIWYSVAVLRRRQGSVEPAMNNGPQGAAASTLPAPTTPPKKLSWSYLRGAHTRSSNSRSRCAVTHQNPLRRGVPCLERALPRLQLRRRPHSPLCYPGPQYV
jgi:hypothetical protein